MVDNAVSLEMGNLSIYLPPNVWERSVTSGTIQEYNQLTLFYEAF